VKIENIEVIPVHLPFKAEFLISRGSVVDKNIGAPHIYIKVIGINGIAGWGESRPSHRWSYETEESVVSTIKNYLAPKLIGKDPFDINGPQFLKEDPISGIEIDEERIKLYEQ
jgi:muconate cycloisomerase